MDVLDADGQRLGIGRRYAERDIVQVSLSLRRLWHYLLCSNDLLHHCMLGYNMAAMKKAVCIRFNKVIFGNIFKK